MPQSPTDQSGNSSVAPSSDLGANEWLVDEMREQYAADPGSVTPEWAAYFSAQRQRCHRDHHVAPAATAPAAPAPAPTPAAPAAPAARARRTGPARRSAPTGSRRGAGQAAPSSRRRRAGRRHHDAGRQGPEAAAPAAASDEPTHTVLRGIAAATAKNMDISLAVPTATSVRNIPVKLLWDNRIVINNHLKRARGGKVSFTHLIGYAIVKAIKTLPEMNNTFAEVDGKPNMVTPAHINLGLAIDQQKPDGTRQLVAPSIKACESMDFAQFWTAYEEIVRKAKDNKLTMEDYSGTTVSLTNVGGLGTNNSVPRLMQGQAAIIGVGSMDYPPESQGASEETLTRNAICADHDDDLDVRPPRHPGRAVGRVPAPRAPAAARRGRLLRRDLPQPADPLRADPLGQSTCRTATTRTSASRPASSS